MGRPIGETIMEAESFLDQELKQGYINEYTMDNPQIPGKQIRCLRLIRDSDIVKDTLTLE